MRLNLNRIEISELAEQGLTSTVIAGRVGGCSKTSIIRFCQDNDIVLKNGNGGNSKLASETVSALISKGLTASQIAATVGGGHTKSSIIGFCSRRSIALRSHPGGMRSVRPQSLMKLMPPQPNLLLPSPVMPEVDLSNHQCQWPDECRDLRQLGKPYCPSHTEIAFVKGTRREANPYRPYRERQLGSRLRNQPFAVY